MAIDLLIKNGLVVDGTGKPGELGDVGIRDGKIASIGTVGEKVSETIDAEGHVVAPGFVDGHTHMDAQVFWDHLGSCSCYHGVTSVVMGNCGFTLAPCREAETDLVFRNLERAEDISRNAMLAGFDWCWESYPDHLNAVEDTPKGINYAGYIGHSALRTYVMRDRAFTDMPTQDELVTMGRLVQESIHAGALGFSTSRSPNHETSDRKPVARRVVTWDEVKYIISKMDETGAGIFEIASENTGGDPEKLTDYQNRLRHLAVECGVPVTFGMFSSRHAPEYWRRYFEYVDSVNDAGGTMFTQVHSRALNVILSFETHTPFDSWEVWRDIRKLPKAEQKAKLMDAEIKAKLVEVASRQSARHKSIGAEIRSPNWHWLFLMDEPSGG